MKKLRDYTSNEKVQNFYRKQHSLQTLDLAKKSMNSITYDKYHLTLWEALLCLNGIIDESDPDTDLTQLEHALQAAEAARSEYPDDEFIQIAALIHDLGKILVVYDLPQYLVVGDTFPLGCKFSNKNIFSEFFKENKDYYNEKYNTELGIYYEHCSFESVIFSFGHDEYLYQVLTRNKVNMPKDYLYCIRYHSFYPWHSLGAYSYLASPDDWLRLYLLQKFNTFDLYSKTESIVSECKIKYWKTLVNKHFPQKLWW